MKEYSKKNSKNYLSQILLNTKQYLSNNKFFIKNSNESEDALNNLSLKNINDNNEHEHQLVQSLHNFSSFSKLNTTQSRNLMNNSNTYNDSNNLNIKKIFNSKSFNNYQKLVIGSKIINSSEDILPPPLLIEEKKIITKMLN